MSPTVLPRMPSGTAALALLAIVVTAQSAMGQIRGTATYRERIALPPNAVFEATLEDTSRVGAASEVIARTQATSPGNPPIAFTIAYDAARILAERMYVVRGRILVDGKLMFTTDAAYPVLTRSNGNTVSLLMRRAGDQGASTPAFEKTFWRAARLGDRQMQAVPGTREVHLLFEEDGRVTGFDGCNTVTGTYKRSGDAISFSQMAGTRMACATTSDIEQAFRDVLKSSSRMRITAGRLELLDAAGKVLGQFDARVK